ncbi:hypothetical protein RI129_012502 [Pyrocoelia pectoralis]|uniref:UDP-glucuronosyltransferase n=1 Tax=Pyrocoelia pectoralis TaxID=417401 RepID=A0AAN7ZC58_9COLE
MFAFINLIVLISGVNGARILGIIPSPCYSHQAAFHQLWRELSLRGHQVTTITTHPLCDPTLTNLTEIDPTQFFENGTDLNVPRIVMATQVNIALGFREYFEQMADIMDKQFSCPPVKRLIDDPDAKFDLVMGEYFFGGVFAFAKRFGCPSIGIISLDGLSYQYTQAGSLSHSTSFPDYLVATGEPLTFSERVLSFLYALGIDLYVRQYNEIMQQRVVDKHFGRNYASVYEIFRNISSLFLNANSILHQIRPLVPGIIHLRGEFHRSPSKPLPKDLQAILDSAYNGIIYFSFGSNVKFEYLPPKLIEALSGTFAELPYTVLWKHELGFVRNKSDNVIVSKWLPQQDILRHPNIKLFITQGGLQSMDEAIYEHVPMIGIPFFGDQPYNVKKMVSKGFGLELDHRNLEKEELKATILEVINNPKYRNTIKELAELAQDQPMTGIEKAVWWTEYVIRHKGAKHLRSPLLDIPWYQYLLLDVIGVLVLSTLVIVCLVYFLIRKLVRFVKSRFLKKSVFREKKD